MRKQLRLTRRRDIKRVVVEGEKAESPWATVYYLAERDTRAAFSARKSLGNSPARNRARRRLREFFRLHAQRLPVGWYLFVAKARVLDADFSELCQGLFQLACRSFSSSS